MRRLAALALIGLLAAGCAPRISNHGAMPVRDRMDDVAAGVDTRGSVLRKLGRPSAVGSFDDARWYYIASRMEATAFLAPEETERQVVAVDFDEQGVVRAVERYGLDDAREIAFADETTPSYGRQLTVAQQLFGNLGRLDADALAGRQPGPTGR